VLNLVAVFVVHGSIINLVAGFEVHGKKSPEGWSYATPCFAVDTSPWPWING
jgi:hypothetical protein